jgi:hypothetical protein
MVHVDRSFTTWGPRAAASGVGSLVDAPCCLAQENGRLDHLRVLLDIAGYETAQWASRLSIIGWLAFAVTLLLVGSLGIMWAFAKKKSASDGSLGRLEEEIASALGRPGLRLPAVPAEIRDLEEATGNLLAENETLRRNLKDFARQVRRGEGDTIDTLVASAIVSLRTAQSGAEMLRNDPDFAAVDQAIAVCAGISQTIGELESLAEIEDPGTLLPRLLENGQLNVALTVAGFLDAYFSDRDGWRRLRAGCRASEAAIVCALATLGVDVTFAPILGVYAPDALPGERVPDRRNIRKIPAVQRRAARLARSLGERDCLIVDCHVPGWISDKIGQRIPSLTIFDRSSWT